MGAGQPTARQIYGDPERTGKRDAHTGIARGKERNNHILSRTWEKREVGVYVAMKYVSMKKVIKMREMSDNQSGVIRKVSSLGEMGRRIREMGLVTGTPIKIQGRAPLRDPVAVKIRDYTLTLRNSEADHILVEVEDSE